MLCKVIDMAFLSTLPARGATSEAAPKISPDKEISIHAPREGSDHFQRG